MDQIRKSIRSTQINDNDDLEPPQEANNPKTHLLFAAIIDTGKIYTDQTGRFPVTSSKGHKYVLILYDFDTSVILTEPLKNRTASEILRAYSTLVTYLRNRGFQPCIHWLGNEASNLLMEYTIKPNKLHINWYHHTCIVAMQPKGQFAPGKITLLRDYAAPTLVFQCTSGIGSPHKQH
jgi:hypothetical protein